VAAFIRRGCWRSSAFTSRPAAKIDEGVERLRLPPCDRMESRSAVRRRGEHAVLSKALKASAASTSARQL
jgi:hypothetical protein